MLASIGTMSSYYQGTFSPSSLPGLKLWLYADSLSLNDNDPVTTWADQSGNGNNAEQSTVALKPIYKTNIQNAKPIVRFDGSDDFMQVANTAIIGGETGLSIFIVAKETTPQINKSLLAKWDFQTQGCFAFQTSYDSSSNFMIFIADAITDAGGNRSRTTDSGLISQFYLLEMIYDGTQSAADRVRLYKNKDLPTQSIEGTIPTSLTSCSATLKVGYFGGDLQRNYDGDIGEILIYNTVLSGTPRQSVENYLNNKWNLY